MQEENAIKPKRKTKDSVFLDLFRDKENLLEAQSTWTVNILIRMLMYLAQSYMEYFRRTSQSLYKGTKVIMPKPELYVIYTGERGERPEVISLSDEFFDGEDIDIEVKARVIYEGDTQDIINQYIIFCKIFDEQRRLHGMTERTVTETIRICQDRNVLKQYLLSKKKEVVTIMMSLFDEDENMEIYFKDRERTMAEEVTKRVTQEVTQQVTEQVTQQVTEQVTQQVSRDKDRQTAQKLLKLGKLTIDDLPEYFPDLTPEDIRAFAAIPAPTA